MRQGFVRGLTLCALTVVALAPIASAGAAGGGAPVVGDGGPGAATSAAPTTAPTWSEVVARAQRLGRVVKDATTPAPGPSAGVVAAAAATITVTPDTDLVSGQRVAVTGTGFSGSPVVIVECGAGAAGPLDCDLNSFDVLNPAANGSVSTQFAVHRRVVASTGTVECADAPGACVIGLTPIVNVAGIEATAPISFDPNAPAPDPSITVTPGTGLLDQQQVTVQGAGFAPGDRLRIRQCSTVDPLCEGYPDVAFATAAGTFTRSYTVRLRAFDAEGNASHCLSLACQVRVISSGNSDYEAAAPIAFAPGQPLPPTPRVVVTPSSQLHHHQSVQVSGTGFDPSAFVAISECIEDQGNTACDEGGSGTVTDAQGAFSQPLAVSRLVGMFGTGGFVIGDCVVSACSIQAAGSFDETERPLSARAPIGFDPSEPVPQPPAVTATPDTNLPFAADVIVSATGFGPGEDVFAEFCASSIDFLGCRGFRDGVTDANGALSLTIGVRRIVGSGRNSADCTDTAVTCTIMVSGAFSYERATIPITFDPNAPIPPQPAIVVTPNTGLHHLDTVQVTGSNFAANAQVDLSECEPGASGYCEETLGFTQADAGGAFSTSVRVSRLLAPFDFIDGSADSVVDCAEEQCSIGAVAYDGEDDAVFAAADIAFDASVPPPAVPVVTVDPHTDLPYRSTVTVRGTGFAPGEQVTAYTCATGSRFGFCGDTAFGTADANGAVSIPITARRITGYEDEGFIDCVDPGSRCYVSVSGQHGYERSQVELAFDPDAPVPPAPTATATPDAGLGYSQSVTVAGDGFAPGTVPISECTESAPIGRFCVGYAELQADATGHVAGTFAVRRILKPGFIAPIDCLTAGCTLRIGNQYPDEHADVALGFDPNAVPPPPPTIVVSPRTHLRHGQTVSVHGSHFAPGALVGLAPCKRGATQIADDCDIARAFAVGAGADGSFTATTRVSSVLATARGPVDCTKPDGACILAAANASDLSEFAHRALSFEVPDLMAHEATVTEGTGSDKEVHVMVEVSAPSDAPRTVTWNAVPGTADASDYGPTRGTVTIPAHATEAMLHLHVKGDAIDEDTERFAVAVDAPGTHVVHGSATVTIRDDDAPPRVAIHDGRRREDHGEAHAEVVLSAPSGKTVIVHYVTHHGTARAGSDYARKDSRLIFLPGETRHLVRVALVNDHVHEPTEQFVVEVDRVEQATVARALATVTITDDD
jgi:hypothetical protein